MKHIFPTHKDTLDPVPFELFDTYQLTPIFFNTETTVTLGANSTYHKFCNRAEWTRLAVEQGRLVRYFDGFSYFNLAFISIIILAAAYAVIRSYFFATYDVSEDKT